MRRKLVLWTSFKAEGAAKVRAEGAVWLAFRFLVFLT